MAVQGDKFFLKYFPFSLENSSSFSPEKVPFLVYPRNSNRSFVASESISFLFHARDPLFASRIYVFSAVVQIDALTLSPQSLVLFFIYVWITKFWISRFPDFQKSDPGRAGLEPSGPKHVDFLQ